MFIAAENLQLTLKYPFIYYQNPENINDLKLKFNKNFLTGILI
jgi:hypothetical protein